MVQERFTVSSLMNGERISGFAFHSRLIQGIGEVERKTPGNIPSLFVDLVLKLPTNNKDWMDCGIVPSRNGNLYESTVLTLFGRIIHSENATRKFMQELLKHEDVVDKRFSSDLLQSIAVETITAEKVKPVTVARVIGWVDGRLDEGLTGSIVEDALKMSERSSKDLFLIAETLEGKRSERLRIRLRQIAERVQKNEDYNNMIDEMYQ